MTYGVSWFEIACSDFERAGRFYETIFGVKLQDMQAPGQNMTALPANVEDRES